MGYAVASSAHESATSLTIGSFDISPAFIATASSVANQFPEFSQKVSRVTDRRGAFPYAFHPKCREEH
jgi:hypothetical protein